MNEIDYDPPLLNDSEMMVLQILCRHYMLGKPFQTGRVARYCGVPSWIVGYTLRGLIRRKLVRENDGEFIPAMQINGAPVPRPEIHYENGVKIIKCPKMYARGYALRQNF